ncbi:MAG TPA: spore germination protein GerW family protein [Jiangellaceae bacterium]
MDVHEVITQAQHAFTVRRVFGEPYEKDGVTIIPAARISGGAGGGDGEHPEQGAGSGSGFGLTARPVGAFVVRGDHVTWRPAVDVNQIVLGAQFVAVVVVFTIRALARARQRAQDQGGAARRGLLRSGARGR